MIIIMTIISIIIIIGGIMIDFFSSLRFVILMILDWIFISSLL
jgi:hypothetical protein